MSALLVAASALPTVTSEQLRSLVLVLAASAAAAFLSRIGPRLVLPTVVVEIVLGILIGPEVLDWASEGTYIQFLANFGLALLFFFAGLEVIEKHVPRQAIVRGSLGWTISIGLGIAVGTTALGTLVPILSDSGILPTPVGTAVLGTGVAGEFWPITIMSVFLTGVYGAVAELALLVVFGVITIGTAFLAMRARPPRIVAILRETLHSTGQAAVRLSIALIAALVLLAHDVGFDFVLGAFAAGLIVGLVLDNPDGGVVRMRLEGIGFGFLIPIYFVATGLTFDLDSVLTARGLGLAALFLALLLVVRGTPAVLWLRDLGPRGAGSVAFFGATQLPLVVAIVGIGMTKGAIDSDVAASLIGAAMISVLVYPLIATAMAGAQEWEPDAVASTEGEY